MALANEIRAIAQMASADGAEAVVVNALHAVADWVAGNREGLARFRLRALSLAASKGFELVEGAEEHIALAVEAFEAVHGKVMP